jgi:thiamine pyrophosphate-dependent acetolactate synthase large subunit-like protein
MKMCSHFTSFSAPPTALLPSARYEKIIEAFGGSGYFVKTPQELNFALKNAFEKTNEASLINVMIDPFSQRKQQVQLLKTVFHFNRNIAYFVVYLALEAEQNHS